MLHLLTLPAQRPRVAAALVALITIVLGGVALRVQTRYEIEGFFPEGTPERDGYQRAVELFGRDDRAGVLVVEAAQPFDAAALRVLDALTQRLEQRNDLERVVSPTNALIPVRRQDGNVRLERALPADPRGGLDAERVQQLFATFAKPPYAGALVSRDMRLAVVGALLREDRLGFAARATLLADLEREATLLEQDGFSVRVAGYPLQRVRLARLAAAESRRFLPAALLVILVITALSFRSARAVALPAVVALLAAIWTTGIMGVSGVFPNIFGPAVYVMIVVVGVADAIHLLARRGELLADGLAAQDALVQSLREVGPPCFWASLTTALAFASLVFTEIPMIVDMGLQVAVGVLCAFVATILVYPLICLRAGGTAAPLGTSSGHRLTRFSLWLEGIASQRPGAVVAAFALVLLVGGASATRVRVNSPLLSDLDEAHPIRVTNRLLEERLSGVIPIDLLIEPPRGERIAAYSGEHLDRIDSLTVRLRGVPEVLWATSAADPLRRMGALLRKVPEGDVTSLLPTALLLADEQVEGWVHEGSDMQRIRLRIRDLDTDAAFSLFAKIARAYEEELGRPAEGQITGQGFLAQVANRAMVRQFRAGFGVALLGVTLVLLLAFRDPVLAFVSLLPNLFPVVVVAGVMGAVGIDLRYTSALVLSVVFGLAVDDTIHVLAQLRRNQAASDPIRATCKIAGPGLVLTSVLLACGFGVLLASDFLPLRVMGGLLALTAVLALASDLLLLPALLRLLGRAKKV
jgi:uncharacterized protein